MFQYLLVNSTHENVGKYGRYSGTHGCAQITLIFLYFYYKQSLKQETITVAITLYHFTCNFDSLALREELFLCIRGSVNNKATRKHTSLNCGSGVCAESKDYWPSVMKTVWYKSCFKQKAVLTPILNRPCSKREMSPIILMIVEVKCRRKIFSRCHVS